MCGRVDVDQFANELTPEEMNANLAAMQAEPWGEDRADMRTAFLVWWIFNLLGSSDEKEKPEAEDFYANLIGFIENGTTKEKQEYISPDEAAKLSRGIF